MSETIKCYNGEVNLKYINEIMKKEYRYNVNKEYYLSKDLIYKKIVEGIVLPYKKKKLTLSYNGKGGVITKNHKYVMESAALAFNGMDDRMCGKYHFTKCNTINEEVIYFGNFQPQWGHFLVDWIVRVWFVLENDNSDQKIVYIGKEIQGNYLEFLKLLGIDEKRLMRIDVPTRFKTIIVPEPSHLPGKYYTKEYKAIFDTAIKNAIKKCDNRNYPNRIYFSRKNIRKNGMERGEEQIEKIFKENGFFSYCPEDYSIVEQISFLQHADIVVTTEGSLAHNIVFAQDGIDIVIINKKCSVNPHQFVINQMKRLKVTYLDAYIAFFDVSPPGPYMLSVNNNIARYFEDNQLENCVQIKSYNQKEKQKILKWMIKKYIPTHKRKFMITFFNTVLNPLSKSWKIYHIFYKGDKL